MLGGPRRLGRRKSRKLLGGVTVLAMMSAATWGMETTLPLLSNEPFDLKPTRTFSCCGLPAPSTLLIARSINGVIQWAFGICEVKIMERRWSRSPQMPRKFRRSESFNVAMAKSSRTSILPVVPSTCTPASSQNSSVARSPRCG